MKKIKFPLWAKIIILLYTVTGLASCDSFVEVELPKNQLTSVSVFQNNQTANAALMDIYGKLRDNGMLSGTSLGVSQQLAFYADELNFFGSASLSSYSFYTNSLVANSTFVGTIWSTGYSQIYAANAVIEGVKASSMLSVNDKKQLEGQGLFLRGFIHFYLVNLFGDIPYITTTNYNQNKTANKSKVEEVYNRINADLKEASVLLGDTEFDNLRLRAGKSVVNALLARVSLYNMAWNEAINRSSAVISEQGRFALESVGNVFVKDSKETVWQLQPSVAGKNTDEAFTFILLNAPSTSIALTDDLINSFASNDLRKTSWIGKVSNAAGTVTVNFPFKYKQRVNTATSLEYPIVMRLSEQYLIRAEAKAQQGDLLGAAQDLNVIRSRAGLANTTAVTKEQLIEAVHQERRWEFFTEYGHRFFDLKRSGRINTVLSAVKPGWNSTDVLFPIPANELNLNPNLTPQNQGY